MKILQVGLGGFGRFHLDAWIAMGLRDQLRICDKSPERRKFAVDRGVAASQIGDDFKSMLADADLVDIVTPTDSHTSLCREALEAEKDVFLEKPMTPTSAEAKALHADDRKF